MSAFISRYAVLLIYLAVINVVTFIVFVCDKRKAIKGKYRIRESVLFLLAFIGGALGGLLAMIIARHKIRKKKFTIGLPLILIVHLAAIVYLIIRNTPK